MKMAAVQRKKSEQNKIRGVHRLYSLVFDRARGEQTQVCPTSAKASKIDLFFDLD